MKARVRDWNKLLGKDVRVVGDSGIGSLCGYEADGSGGIARVRIAFAPGEWEDFPAVLVELVTTAGTPWLPLKQGSP